MSSGYALYLCQVSRNNLEHCQSYRVDTISIGKITKGNNSAKMQVEQLLLITARRLSCFIFLLSFVKLSRTVSQLLSEHDFYTENYKGYNSAKNLGGQTVFNLCTSSGHALYFYQVL